MFQALFKWGLCLLSAFSNPLVQVLPLPTPLIEVQARGPGVVRIHHNQQIYTAQKDLQLTLPYNAAIQVEAIAQEASQIKKFQINGESIPQAQNQTTWTQPLTLKKPLSIQVTFFNPSSRRQNATNLDNNSSFFTPLSSQTQSDQFSLHPLKLNSNQETLSNSQDEPDSSFFNSSLQNEELEPQETLDQKQEEEILSSLSHSSTSSIEKDFEPNQETPKEPEIDLDQNSEESEDFSPIGPIDEDESQSDLELPRKEDEKEDPLKEEEDENKEGEEEPLEEGQYLGYTSSDLKILVKQLPLMSVKEVFDFFKTNVEQVQNDCQKGYGANWMYLRAALANCLGVLDRIDSEAYLSETLFEENPNFLTQTPEAIVLQKSAMQPKVLKQQARAAARNASASESVSVVSAMLYQNISIFGNYISNYIWILSNNQHAFCASYLKAPPKTGALASSVVAVDNEALRKALYYGFAGPGNTLKEWSTEQQIIITNDLVSLAFSNTCIAKGELDGKMWRTGLKAIWDRIQSLPDPQNYQAYIANFPGTGLNHLNQTVEFQPLAFGRYEEPPVPDLPPQTPPTISSKPALQLLKTTSDDIISNTGQKNYSLVGAKYEIRKGSNYTSGTKVATLTIGNDLSSEILEVESAGTYWAQEIQAPKGFALDSTAYRIEVPENCTAQAPVRILVYDSPQYCKVNVLAKKIDGETKQPLAHAIFELRYYAIDPSNPSAYRNAVPSASWILKSDENGEVKADLAHIYKADYDFPRPVDNPTLAVFPIGVVTLQEIQAPSGYALNDKVYAMGLSPTSTNTTQTCFEVYQAPTIENRVAKIQLEKTDIQHVGLPGAEFSVKDPQGNVQVLALDSQGKGEVTFDQNGTWTIWESKAPLGYTLNTTKAVFKVTGSSITCDCPSENAYVTYADHLLTIQNLGVCYGLKISKTDPSGKPLANAVFDLYTIPNINALNSKTLVAKATTDTQGIATFGNLEPSKTYVLLESQAPSGYVLPQHEDGTRPEYVLNVQTNTSSSQTALNESGYIMFIRPYNLSASGQPEKPNYIYRDKKTYGFSWDKEDNLITIAFDSVNEPLESQELPHTGSLSTLSTLMIGNLLVWYGLKKPKKYKNK